jgi:hypothetical protein
MCASVSMNAENAQYVNNVSGSDGVCVHEQLYGVEHDGENRVADVGVVGSPQKGSQDILVLKHGRGRMLDGVVRGRLTHSHHILVLQCTQLQRCSLRSLFDAFWEEQIQSQPWMDWISLEPKELHNYVSPRSCCVPTWILFPRLPAQLSQMLFHLSDKVHLFTIM